MMNGGLSSSSINDYGNFDDIKKTVDKDKAKAYFEELEDEQIPSFKVNIRVHSLLERFILSGGFEI